jgi:hypothetical protein
MGEEFYCILKLVSGEEIFSLISIDENDGDTLIILQNPIVMKMINNQKGNFVKIKPWMEISTDDLFIIRLDKVITMTETKDEKLISIYNNYISEEDSIEVYKPGGSVKPSEKMGYIGSVEASRKRLENLFKGIKES